MEVSDVWWPQRVTDAMKALVDFAEYKKKRIFTFAHFLRRCPERRCAKIGSVGRDDSEVLLLRPGG
jgi:hypothetical protein